MHGRPGFSCSSNEILEIIKPHPPLRNPLYPYHIRWCLRNPAHISNLINATQQVSNSVDSIAIFKIHVAIAKPFCVFQRAGMFSQRPNPVRIILLVIYNAPSPSQFIPSPSSTCNPSVRHTHNVCHMYLLTDTTQQAVVYDDSRISTPWQNIMRRQPPPFINHTPLSMNQI